ncbi:hypothetical protein ACFL6C_06470 [Myxococcota bacterium]
MRYFPVALVLLLLAQPALADDDCLTDADCPDSLLCEEVGATSCPVPDCREDPCPEPAPCETEIHHACVPGVCETDADCGAGLLCLTFEDRSCHSSPVDMPDDCPPEGPCEPNPSEQEPPECQTISVTVCAPPYMAECADDADCGDGFGCVEMETCECSGGGSDDGELPDPEPPQPDDPTPPECSCEPTGQLFCEPIEQSCDADGDCIQGWSCEEPPQRPTECKQDASGEVICDDPPEPDPWLCTPPLWDFFDGAPVGSKTTAELNSQGAGPSARVDVEVGCRSSASSGAASLLALAALVVRRKRR